jgi:hypothetical protein
MEREMDDLEVGDSAFWWNSLGRINRACVVIWVATDFYLIKVEEGSIHKAPKSMVSKNPVEI